jgi:hypothetical protein
LQEFIPPSRWYLEALHLIINTGNGWIEVARNTLQYLLKPDASVRDRKGEPPDMWPLATSGSKQPRSWRLAGFDFEQHLVNVLGPRLRKPLTKYHGAQVEAVFKRQDEIWVAEPLATGLRELERDAEVAAVVENLQAVFKALSVVHEQINQPKADLETLQAAVDAFASNVRISSGTRRLHVLCTG